MNNTITDKITFSRNNFRRFTNSSIFKLIVSKELMYNFSVHSFREELAQQFSASENFDYDEFSRRLLENVLQCEIDIV